MSEALLILNPRAGAIGARPPLLATLQAHPRLSGVEVALCGDLDETRARARRARDEGRRRLLVAGGDGTVHHAVNGLLDGVDGDLPDPADLPVLCVLPAGTGNDLARSLGMPPDPWAALDALDWRRTRRMDLIRCEGAVEGWCANLVAGGLASPRPDPVTGGDPKRGLGVLAYWRRGVEALTSRHPGHRLRITLDGGERHELRAQNLLVANGRTVAGGLPVAPEALLDDGLLDVVVVPELEMAETGLLLPLLVMGAHTEHDALLVRRARGISFEADPALELGVDGEPATAASGTLRVAAGALRVVVGPPDADGRAVS